VRRRFTRFVCRTCAVQAELKYCPFKVVPTVRRLRSSTAPVQLSWRREVRSNRSRWLQQANGDVAVVVKHGEETVEYTITQILAMYAPCLSATCPGTTATSAPGPSHSCVGTCGRYLAKLKRIVEKEARAPHRLGATPHTSPSANAATTLADVAGAWADVGGGSRSWVMGRCGFWADVG
jgi:hypothetical protein